MRVRLEVEAYTIIMTKKTISILKSGRKTEIKQKKVFISSALGSHKWLFLNQSMNHLYYLVFCNTRERRAEKKDACLCNNVWFRLSRFE
mmetsp:Transcript_16341/g.46701  ORF Transcript_16341/g.46701 Transcript_16341/m.46701 type:complete len:89 (-) Transcript_16341:800-1066(-)